MKTAFCVDLSSSITSEMLTKALMTIDRMKSTDDIVIFGDKVVQVDAAIVFVELAVDILLRQGPVTFDAKAVSALAEEQHVDKTVLISDGLMSDSDVNMFDEFINISEANSQ